ncbi:MAG: hypothetical protein PHF29_10725 [Candidatus Riflebacteria bacterium]|nr:hypothetical protein [Candidatus Riflebacteria bacterium]
MKLIRMRNTLKARIERLSEPSDNHRGGFRNRTRCCTAKKKLQQQSAKTGSHIASSRPSYRQGDDTRGITA